MSEDTISDIISTVADGPASATADGVSVTQHNLRDLIAADKHVAASAASTDPWKAIRRRQIVPPGGE